MKRAWVPKIEKKCSKNIQLKLANKDCKEITFKWLTIVLRLFLYSETGTCCRSQVLPKRAASFAPKKIVVATGGAKPSYKAYDDLLRINLYASTLTLQQYVHKHHVAIGWMELSYQWKDVMYYEKSPPCVVSTIASDNYISLAQMDRISCTLVRKTKNENGKNPPKN